MSQVQGVVAAVSTKFGKFSINVNDTWYNTKQEYAPSILPDKGDSVEFDDGGKNYLKKLKIVKRGEGEAPKPSQGTGNTGKAPSQRFSNLGVELGHASNLAMRVMEKRIEPGLHVTLSDVNDYLDEWEAITLDIYKRMSVMRKRLEGGPIEEKSNADLQKEVEKVEQRAAPKPKPAPVTDDDDLF